jgi:hypothetical protein
MFPLEVVSYPATSRVTICDCTSLSVNGIPVLVVDALSERHVSLCKGRPVHVSLSRPMTLRSPFSSCRRLMKSFATTAHASLSALMPRLRWVGILVARGNVGCRTAITPSMIPRLLLASTSNALDISERWSDKDLKSCEKPARPMVSSLCQVVQSRTAVATKNLRKSVQPNLDIVNVFASFLRQRFETSSHLSSVSSYDWIEKSHTDGPSGNM